VDELIEVEQRGGAQVPDCRGQVAELGGDDERWPDAQAWSERLVRAPVGLYRARLGFLLGSRLLMLEHTGRKSGARRYVVLEVVGHPRPRTYVVASGFGGRPSGSATSAPARTSGSMPAAAGQRRR
jgi:hypothetical protein